METKDIVEIKRLVTRMQQLAHNEIPPSRVIGVGYKNPRKEAFQYLADRLMDEITMAEGGVPEVYDSTYYRNLRVHG